MTFWSDRFKKLGVASITFALVSAPAFASAQELGEEAGALVLSSSSIYVGLGITAVGLTIVPFGLTTTAGGAAATATDAAALELYLRENQVEVREALVMGQGEVVEDIGATLGLDGVERVVLGRVLRASRAELGELADPARLTPERASAFGVALWDAMSQDPTLAAALARRQG